MNFYEILGVTPDSELADIKSAYRKLARKYHPDVNPDGARRFKEISRAYDTLSDVNKRKQYDTLNGFFKSTYRKDDFKKEFKTNPNKDFSKKSEPKTNSNEQKKSKSSQQENKFSGIFNSFFDANFHESKNEKIQPQNGKDITTDIAISLSEAVKGTNRVVNVVHTELCPRCRGRKFINGSKCQVCNGTGEYSLHKRINVKIPVNVKNGAKLRIKGEGGEGQFGGKNGDLYLLIHIEGTSRVKYDNLNLLYDLPITPYEAVLGGEIDIPTIEGKVKLKLPPHTSSGQKFRLSGQGLKRNGKVGDMIVTVSIEISKHLSDDEIKLYEKLKKIAADNIRENLLNE